MRSVVSDAVSFSIGFMLNGLNKNALINESDLRSFIISEPATSVVPNFGGYPSSSLTLLNGKCLAMSSPFFSGFASYNLYGRSIQPGIKISYEILEIMGVSKRNLDSLMLGGALGAIVGGIAAACLASGPVGLIIGTLGAVCGAICSLFLWLEKKKEANRKHNLMIAQNVGLAHMLLLDVAREFNQSGLLAYDNDFREELTPLLSSENINRLTQSMSEIDSYKLRIEDLKDIYNDYYERIKSITTAKEKRGLLISESSDLSDLGIEVRHLVETSTLPGGFNLALSSLDALPKIISLLNIRNSDSNAIAESSGFQFVLPREEKNFSFVFDNYPAVVSIEPAASSLYSTGFKSELISSSFKEEQIIKANVKGVTAYARLLIEGAQGVQLLSPVLTEVTELKKPQKYVITEGNEFIVSSTNDPTRLITAVCDKGKLITMSHVIRSSTSFRITESSKKGWYPSKERSYLSLDHEGKGEIKLLKLLANCYPREHILPKVEIIQLFNFLLDGQIVFGAIWDEINSNIQVGWFPLSPNITYQAQVGLNLNFVDHDKFNYKSIMGAAYLLKDRNMPWLTPEGCLMNYKQTYSYLQRIYKNHVINPEAIEHRNNEVFYKFGDLYIKNLKYVKHDRFNHCFPLNYLTASQAPNSPVISRCENIALACYFGMRNTRAESSYEFYS